VQNWTRSELFLLFFSWGGGGGHRQLFKVVYVVVTHTDFIIIMIM